MRARLVRQEGLKYRKETGAKSRPATRSSDGVSRDEVKELLMHPAIYCGVPAAFGAFQLAAQIFDKMDQDASA